jgi:hypothetical protein
MKGDIKTLTLVHDNVPSAPESLGDVILADLDEGSLATVAHESISDHIKLRNRVERHTLSVATEGMLRVCMRKERTE